MADIVIVRRGSKMMADMKLEVVCGVGCRRYEEEDLEGISEVANAVSSIIRAFASSAARVLLLECSAQPLQTKD